MKRFLPLLTALAAVLALPAQAAAVTGRDVKIVGGLVGAPGQFPWMAALVDSSSPLASDGQFCGGAVIAPRVVLTAAHCLEGTRPEDLDVVVGRTRLSTDTDGERVNVTAMVLHPRYNARSIINDIALLQLDRPVSVPALTLPGPQDGPLQAPAAKAFTSGWGSTAEGGNRSDDLLYVRLTVRAAVTCGKIYGRINDKTQLCAGSSRPNEDSCQGDSGGPFFAGQGDQARLLGVVSYGTGCGRRGVPGVYTRVSGFLGWINENAPFLNGDAPPPPPPVDPPRVRIGSIDCGAVMCRINLRVRGRAPAGGILLNASRPRRPGKRPVERYAYAREVEPGRWRGRLNLPVGRIKLYAFPMNAERDDLDGDGDVERLVVTVG